MKKEKLKCVLRSNKGEFKIRNRGCVLNWFFATVGCIDALPTVEKK
jgi:hypothetical protein